MKKGREYVTSGLLDTTSEGVFDETPFEGRLHSALSPADLPRDYGMAGAVGAYEVPSIERTVKESLDALLASFTEDDPLAEVNAALDQLLPAADRIRVVAEAVKGSIVTLSLLHRADKFLYNRTLIPQLKKLLLPTLGPITIRIMDR